MSTPQSSATSLEGPAEAQPGGLKAALRDTFVGAAWRGLKARRKEAALKLGPEIARRRAALRADAEARLRALAERRPERARAFARALGPGAEAILTARTAGWAAAAPLFARLDPGDRRAEALLRRAPGPALALAVPAADRPVDLPPERAAGLVIYTTRFGPEARVLAPLGRVAGLRMLCLSDRDDPAEGWEVVRFALPPDVDPSLPTELWADLCRIRPEVALAAAAPAAEASLYLAPEALLAGNLDTLVARWLWPQDLAAWRHPRAAGWADVAEAAALAAPPARRAAVLAQARACEAAGLPPEAGATDSRLVWRRHRTPAAAALAEAWWRAFAPHPGDADLALARALAEPAPPPAPRVLPAALGTAEDNLYTAVSPVGPSPAPRRPVPGRRPGAARPRIAIVHQRGYEHYASTLLRAEQLAGLLAERLGERYEFSYVTDTAGLRDQIVVLTKWALEWRKPAEIAALRAKNAAVIASWDDKIPTAELAAVVDAQMTLSISQAVELGRRFPATPTFFVTHHVNRLIRPGAPPMDRLRAGYFGELFNTVRPASLADEIELNGINTTAKTSGPTAWMDALDRYNLHWIVRRRHYFDGAKPFLKCFVAARCGAVVMVARDDGDAAYYLGDDYPFYVRGLDPTTLEADWLRAASAFGGPDWRMAQAIMRQVAARSTDAVVCDQFDAMIRAITQ